MGLSKQAKTLNKKQEALLLVYVGDLRNGLRNQVIVLLSTKAGLRAKEIANLTWEMVTDPDGNLDDYIRLENRASKGSSGRMIPINKDLKFKLQLLQDQFQKRTGQQVQGRIVTTERSAKTSPQVIVNMFQSWYSSVTLKGCSSHSGRRTFITNAAKRIGSVGGSLRDVQALAGHSSLQTTQGYIEGDSEARKKIVDMV